MKNTVLRVAAVVFLAITARADAAKPVALSPVEVHTWSNPSMLRKAYLRSETLPVDVVLNHPGGTGGGSVHVELGQGGKCLIAKDMKVSATTGVVSSVTTGISLRDYRRDVYEVSAEWRTGTNVFGCKTTVMVCGDLDTNGLAMGLWWESAYKKQGTAEAVSRFRSLGLNVLQTMVVYPELLDHCLWEGVQCVSITHGYARGADGKPIETGDRLMASGQPFMLGKSARWSIANTNWQRAMAGTVAQEVAKYMLHPAYVPMVNTSDDYFLWTGLDYNAENVRRFKAMTGLDAPRPPEAVSNGFPLVIARAKGVIPDTDPWVQWMRFLCRDVLGHYDRLLADAVFNVTGGRGRIGPVSGGGLENVMGFVPYVDVLTGQWPPYNFGANGFSLLCCYNYNFYRYPALSQVWWYELGRMGNRNLPQWLMPETMDKRMMVHLQNFHLYMAAAQDGLMYFISERNTPGADEAFRRLAPLHGRLGKLFTAIKPAARRVGLLMPFEQSCFRTQYPVDAQFAFCNLIMAQTDVQPVTPEEVAGGLVGTGTVLLHDIDWLTEESCRSLKLHIKHGGKVICDSLSEVKVPGAVRLDLALGCPDRETGYGNPDDVARIRAALQAYAEPWAWSDDPHWMLRRFHLDGVDYLWVVNLMTRKQDSDHIPVRDHEREADTLPAYRGMESAVSTACLHIATSGVMVQDVFKARSLDTVTSNGVMTFTVETAAWQGTLLALYRQLPDRIEIESPKKGRTGRDCAVRIRVLAAGSPLAATVPITIRVLNPDGNMNTAYSRQVLAREGQCEWRIPFAVNDILGRYALIAREETTGIESRSEITLHSR